MPLRIGRKDRRPHAARILLICRRAERAPTRLPQENAEIRRVAESRQGHVVLAMWKQAAATGGDLLWRVNKESSASLRKTLAGRVVPEPRIRLGKS